MRRGQGFQLNTHAIGDRANQLVLDAYANATAVARGHVTDPSLRLQIEHAQVIVRGLPPSALCTYAAFVLTPSPTGAD
jgi:predicted amidohydrolase YtcJ